MTRVVAAVLAATVAGAALAVVALAFAGPRAALVDAFQPAAPAPTRVAVVAADARFTTAAQGDPFAPLSNVVANLADAGAAAIVLEPDALRLVQAQLAVSLPTQAADLVRVALTTLGNVVTASVPGDLSGDPAAIPRLSRPVPLSDVAAASVGTGFSTPLPESARRERTVPLLARAKDGLIPSVVLAALLAAGGESGRGRIEGDLFIAGNLDVTIEGGMRLRVNYTDALLPGGDAVFSASDVAEEDFDASILEDRVVFVGVTDPAYAQQFPSPVGQVPVVFVDANAANTILTGAFLSAPSTATGLWLGLLAVAAVAVVGATVPLWLAPLPAVAAVGFLWRLSDARVQTGQPIDLLPAIAAVLGAGIAVVLMRVAQTARQRRRTAALFEQYVPDEVARRLLATPQAHSRSERVEIATFFCDLRGFTAAAAALEPDDVRRLLDRYYEFVANAVLDTGGTVMQFVGDEVFAVFGAPLPHVGPAEAVATALAVLEGGEEFRNQLATEGLPEVGWGIGLHAGPAVAAHIGTHRRRQYAVIGDTINVGSRLCGQAGANEAVLSEEFWLAAGQPDAHPLGPLELKGVGRQIHAYRIIPTVAADAHSQEPRAQFGTRIE